jgi:hypothetical protein
MFIRVYADEAAWCLQMDRSTVEPKDEIGGSLVLPDDEVEE